ncbi:hypothetical protein IQ254_20185 [Nodosilinea sp. LEGE 07088]|uniref:hypothetical protein n=1 Tax=Nodosilinea sp. LEGE 07088 TaxID=2777968 RepID=UPI001882A0E1|nr:hypothetical protein [Nodosilinea sp. LEGE 07088]MBE9139488.1 hypothetical protein [Nodosilinea sp. LEGE 07088]
MASVLLLLSQRAAAGPGVNSGMPYPTYPFQALVALLPVHTNGDRPLWGQTMGQGFVAP